MLEPQERDAEARRVAREAQAPLASDGDAEDAKEAEAYVGSQGEEETASSRRATSGKYVVLYHLNGVTADGVDVDGMLGGPVWALVVEWDGGDADHGQFVPSLFPGDGDAARRAALEAIDWLAELAREGRAELVAVPARSWQPSTPRERVVKTAWTF
jgi:hypothetical protein